MSTHRLPTPGGDDDEWGTILNDYLGVSHAGDGTLKSGSTVGTGALQSGNNLSDVQSLPGARTNLGLGNVNNTADADKPVSTLQQAALDAKFDTVGGTVNGDVTIDGNLDVTGSINVFAVNPPVITVTLYPQGGCGYIQKDVPLYYRQDGTWYASETLQSLPFTQYSGYEVARLGFEPAQVVQSNYKLQILACGLTAVSVDGTQICGVYQGNPFEVADGYEQGYDPVLWDSTVASLGTQLSLSNDSTTIITDTDNVFQVSAWFNATLIYDDGSGHQSN